MRVERDVYHETGRFSVRPRLAIEKITRNRIKKYLVTPLAKIRPNFGRHFFKISM